MEPALVRSSSGYVTTTEQRKSEIHDENNGLSRPVDSYIHHAKVYKSFTGLINDTYYANYGSTSMFGPHVEFVLGNLGSFIQPPKLKFQENNDFSVIQAVAELDDTIAMFSKKFIKSLFSKSSYGAISWGVVPFVNDLKALYSNFEDIFLGKAFSERVRRCRVAANIPRTVVNANYFGTVHGNVRLSGTYTLPDLTIGDALAIILDELGANPDLSLAWDLVPLSFAANYFLPIGKAIDTLHPRGWYEPEVLFDGTVSLKLHCTSYLLHPNDSANIPAKGLVSGKVYRRMPYSYSFGPQKFRPKMSWKAPLAEQLFSAAYLYMQSRPRPVSRVPRLKR